MIDALLALDRLNRYARVPGCIVSPSLIYGMKDRAILRLCEAGRATIRRVQYQVPTCGHCGGNGWHRAPREYDPGDGCHRCGGYGLRPGHGRGATLHFVETTILLDLRDPIVWHSPANHAYGGGADLWNRLEFTAIGDVGTWRPQSPGEPLAAHETARDLLTVEDWLGPCAEAWPGSFTLHIPKGTIAEDMPDVLRWRERHPEPAAWPASRSGATP